ncbi:MAG: 2OG-Fe(II) oxygenase [Methylocella sp.]
MTEAFDQVVATLLPLARMQRERDSLRAAYAAGRPYPHIVVDGFFDEAVLDRIVIEFPKRDGRDWITWDTTNELKQTSRGIGGLSPFTQLFFMQLCSEPFLEHIRYITGLPDLVLDPLFHGGGLHESVRGGWLNIHADWTKHPALPLTRRLNLIIYLNRDWDLSWGGDLELCDPASKTCGARVAPLFNRAVFFPTTSETLHGFPSPLTCPGNRTRKSISVYYWSPDPEALKEGAYITFLPGKKRTRMRALLRSLTPPIIFKAGGALLRSLRGNKLRAMGKSR